MLDFLRFGGQSRADVRHAARAMLREMLHDPKAEFRDGQWEAIDGLARKRRRLLVVQRTGWGKSLVYFIGACLRRDDGAGLTLIISPLISLMRNQVQMAERLGIRAATINSTNTHEWAHIRSLVRQDKLDILLVSPERLASPMFREQVLAPIAPRLGLLVVDEAHCISDWGHDFRPDYQRIARILEMLPRKTPILATTATANDRVVQDVLSTLGRRTKTQRGALARQSVQLQTLSLPSHAERLAWLAEHTPALPGSGIIYTLTVRDAERVAGWLQSQGIDAPAYHSHLEPKRRIALEDMLLRNEVKALVATVALGMGFDKPDIGFVIHYQRPASVVHYYQQVGRAGRAIERSYGILLGGAEDDEIADYFIRHAFPEDGDVLQILDALNSAPGGLSLFMLEQRVNVDRRDIEQALRLLAVQPSPPVTHTRGRWFREDGTYEAHRETVRRLTRLRREEQRRMQEYMRGGECLMRFLSRELDDESRTPCGRCAVCLGAPILSVTVPPALLEMATAFLKLDDQIIRPRTRWMKGALDRYGWRGSIEPWLRHEPSRALCMWKDEGWGELVQRGKRETGRFDDALVTAAADLVRGRWNPQPPPTWVTCVPSLKHPELVPSFARRLASALQLPFCACVYKGRDTPPQKTMQNRWHQAHNLEGAFHVVAGPGFNGPVLLVDDVVDSGWTFAVIAALLRQSGIGPVFPLALAVTSGIDLL